ncbi:MAG TPA: histidine phosphatase family protein [Acetobacteraceae bacterium]|jgi:broad specificity phosphatase PhoE|nr:histidine phosphatase family protein [Acetobacteraceae bacterium]
MELDRGLDPGPDRGPDRAVKPGPAPGSALGPEPGPDPPPTITRVAFWFLRHGETDWNAQGISQGNVDIPLNEVGLAQARAAAPLLRNRGIASIVASPLSRARVTAEIIAQVLALPVHLDPGLREVHFGVQEGQKMSGWFPDWIAGVRTPDGAETFAALRTRAVAAVNRALTLPPVVLVVAHGAMFRTLRAAMGLEVNVRTQNAIPLFCEPTASGWKLTAA